MNSPAFSPLLRPIEVAFRGDEAARVDEADFTGLSVPMRLLAGGAREALFGVARDAGEAEGFRLALAGGFLVGWSVEPVQGDMAAAAGRLYRRLLRAAGGRHLCRIWNYVPAINEHENGLENYQAFSAGRARAFAAAFGPEYARQLPAASGVGCRGAALAVLFTAAEQTPRHFENPEQCPAYRYPREHGPLPPSFARATVVRAGGRPWAFISGTAAIKGHATVAAGALAAQLDCTLDNLRLISRAAGLGDNLEWPGGSERHFKVYLRRPRDVERVRARLAGSLLRRSDRVLWLESDLCRAELAVEIEATLAG